MVTCLATLDFLFDSLIFSCQKTQNMLAYLPQSHIGKKDKEREKRILLPSTEPVVTGSNPVGCIFSSPQVFVNKRLAAFFIRYINVFLRSNNVAGTGNSLLQASQNVYKCHCFRTIILFQISIEIFPLWRASS